MADTLIVLLVLLAVLWGIFFILTAISTAKMAKDFGIKDSFLAYIPFSQQYMQGKIADRINKNDNEWSLYQVLYPMLTVITVLGYGFLLVVMLTFDEPIIESNFIDSPIVINSIMYMIIFSIISLICIVYLATLYKCHHVIFNEYDPKYAVLYTTLSVFFNIHPILLFLVKDKKNSSFSLLTQQEQIEVLTSKDVEVIPHVSEAMERKANNLSNNQNEDFSSTLNGVEKEVIAQNLKSILEE